LRDAFPASQATPAASASVHLRPVPASSRAWVCVMLLLLLLRCKLGKAAASINIISMCKQTNIPDSLSSQLFNQH